MHKTKQETIKKFSSVQFYYTAIAMSDPKYDVFLSFRGEDTREKFTHYLYAELCRKNIETFIDDKLDRGEEISPALYNAIEESKIYVIILSEHYASSSWCLDELTEILKCKERYKEYGREVIPVFYEVNPSDVRHQRESYEIDFQKHQHRSKDKIDAWKAALTQVANLSGWDSQNFSPESTLVTEFVKDIVKKLNRCVSSDYEGMTGIDDHIEKIQSLLLLESRTVRIIGIWGMGGIGKTTIANAIFEKLATQFSSKSIIRNVQQEIERVGLSHVKKEYLSQLLNETITSSESNSYDPRLKRMKVLLVFDDVKDADQLQDLIGTPRNFGLGSRIILTSRDKQVLDNANADEIYQVSEMDKQDSLQLFCLFAFKQNHPKESFENLTEKVLDYAKGLPLALKVLGSLLYRKAKETWESELRKLKKLPDHKIFSLLKLSYDGLDKDEKDIFLDIACFHRGHSEKHVAITLDSCGFSANIGMDVLKDRSLISISKYGQVWMHDLIQEMGHEIVRLQCFNDPGKHSRLWKTSDICYVLRKNEGKGTDAIKCISLDMREIDEEVQLDADTFKKMHHLRMINFYISFRNNSNVTFNGFLKSFPDELKFLLWDFFPQRSLPPDFCPRNLVTLGMFGSDLEQLWEGNQALPNLKRLDLHKSKKLTRLPDLSLCPNIEEVCLSGCISLTEVYSSSFLNNLYILSVEGCTELKSIDIPSNILSRPSGLVSLSNCYNLETLLISSRTDHVVQFTHSYRYYKFERMKFCLGQWWVYFTRGSFPVTSINDFYWLDISNCDSLTCLPAELLNLKFLTRLDLSGCLKLEELPEIKETMENLKVLNLNSTAIKELPSSLDRLVGLEELSLKGCSIVNLPESIAHLSSLRSLNLSYCKLLQRVPKLPPNLNHVLAYDCPSIKRMMLNSRSDSQEGTFEFNLTNSEELDATSLNNIEEEAYIKINDDAYWSVSFCFPGSAIPDWFRHRCQGHSITIRRDDLYLYGRNRLIGFALCVVLGPDFPYELEFETSFTYELKFESDGETHFHCNKFEIEYDWRRGQNRRFAQNHTFLWKYELDLATIGNGLIDADTITFEILDEHLRPLSFPTTMTVIECGICPLYAKENNDNSIEEPSGSGDAVCLVDLDLSLSGHYTHNKRRKT